MNNNNVVVVVKHFEWIIMREFRQTNIKIVKTKHQGDTMLRLRVTFTHSK